MTDCTCTWFVSLAIKNIIIKRWKKGKKTLTLLPVHFSLSVSAPTPNVSTWWREQTLVLLWVSARLQYRKGSLILFGDGNRGRCQFNDHVWRWVGRCSLLKRIPVTAVAVRLRIPAGESHTPLRPSSAAQWECPTEDEVHHQHVQGIVSCLVCSLYYSNFTHSTCWCHFAGVDGSCIGL